MRRSPRLWSDLTHYVRRNLVEACSATLGTSRNALRWALSRTAPPTASATRLSTGSRPSVIPSFVKIRSLVTYGDNQYVKTEFSLDVVRWRVNCAPDASCLIG